MKYLFLLSLLLNLTGCGTSSSSHDLDNQAQIIKNDPMFIKADCDQNRTALSCARYAYKLKNVDADIYLKYTTLACELGDSSSCFNLDQIKGKKFDYNLSVLKREESHIFACYAHYSSDSKIESMKVDEKDHKILNISALVDQAGKLQKMTLDGRNLNPKMEECVRTVYQNKKFVGADRDMLLSLTLLMPIQYNDKDVAKNNLDGLADSLKDLN